MKTKAFSEAEKEKLCVAYRILDELSQHDLPVLQFNCRKAKNELWQALFELDLIEPYPEEI